MLCVSTLSSGSDSEDCFCSDTWISPEDITSLAFFKSCVFLTHIPGTTELRVEVDDLSVPQSHF